MKFHQDGTLPKYGEIFVFGSNLAGRHGAGAARLALEDYGAIVGLGVGPQGDSYAIPTKDQHIRTLPLAWIRPYVDQFIHYAYEYDAHRERPTDRREFFVTSIGCGLAGYKPEQIAPMFAGAPDNCSFPDTWKPYLEPARDAVRHVSV